MWDQQDEEEEPGYGEQIDELLELIQAQFACKGKSREWTHSVANLYCAALTPIPFAIAREIVVQVILTSPYLPTASDIWQRALDIASPTLPEHEAWRLVDDAMGRRGNPSLPAMVAQAVKDVGGIDALWHRRQFAGEWASKLRAEFVQAYNIRVRDHREAVTQELLKPAITRNRALFPPASPFLQPPPRLLEAGE